MTIGILVILFNPVHPVKMLSRRPARRAKRFEGLIRLSGTRCAGVAAAVCLLLGMAQAAAVEPAAPDTADIGCLAVELLFNHRDDIADAAAHGIPAMVLAGVIAAE